MSNLKVKDAIYILNDKVYPIVIQDLKMIDNRIEILYSDRSGNHKIVVDKENDNRFHGQDYCFSSPASIESSESVVFTLYSFANEFAIAGNWETKAEAGKWFITFEIKDS
jgi:hypothetical protein